MQMGLLEPLFDGDSDHTGAPQLRIYRSHSLLSAPSLPPLRQKEEERNARLHGCEPRSRAFRRGRSHRARSRRGAGGSCSCTSLPPWSQCYDRRRPASRDGHSPEVVWTAMGHAGRGRTRGCPVVQAQMARDATRGEWHGCNLRVAQSRGGSNTCHPLPRSSTGGNS